MVMNTIVRSVYISADIALFWSCRRTCYSTLGFECAGIPQFTFVSCQTSSSEIFFVAILSGQGKSLRQKVFYVVDRTALPLVLCTEFAAHLLVVNSVKYLQQRSVSVFFIYPNNFTTVDLFVPQYFPCFSFTYKEKVFHSLHKLAVCFVKIKLPCNDITVAEFSNTTCIDRCKITFGSLDEGAKEPKTERILGSDHVLLYADNQIDF